MSSEAEESPQPHFKSGTILVSNSQRSLWSTSNHISKSHSEKPARQNQTWKCVEHLHPDLVVLFIQTLSVKLVENTFNDFQRVLPYWKVRVFKNSFEDDISIFAPRFLPWARHSPGGRTTCHLPPCLLSHRGPGQQAQMVIQDWVGDCIYTSQTYYRTCVMVKLMPIIDDGVVVTVFIASKRCRWFFFNQGCSGGLSGENTAWRSPRHCCSCTWKYPQPPYPHPHLLYLLAQILARCTWPKISRFNNGTRKILNIISPKFRVAGNWVTANVHL